MLNVLYKTGLTYETNILRINIKKKPLCFHLHPVLHHILTYILLRIYNGKEIFVPHKHIRLCMVFYKLLDIILV